MSLNKATELRQERAKLYEEAKAEVEANPDGFASSEAREAWDRRMSRIDDLKGEIDAIEKREAQRKELAEELAARQDEIDQRKEFGAKREDAEEQRERHSKAFRSWALGEMSNEEYRTIQGQTKGTAAQGGNTVPVDFAADVITALKAYGGVRQVAKIINTANGRNLDFPTSDDTANVAKIVGEAVAPSTTTRVPFGKKTLEAVTYQSGPIKISMELLQDSAIDIDAYVADAMATRFGRATNAHFTTRSSTEASGPHGFIYDSTGAVIAANGGVTPEKLLSLFHSVDPAYRTPGDVAWMMADATVNTVRAIRWGSSRQFVWQPSVQVGQPDMLFGAPVVTNQDTPLFGTSGNKPIWFGNWKHYYVRDVMGLTMRRLDERYAEEGNIALIGYMRADGRQMTGSTVIARRPYRCILQSTG